MKNENQKLSDKIKKNDVVIFNNVFSILTGRVSDVKKNQEGKIISCWIKCIDPTSMVSTYKVSPNEIIEIINENNQPSQKKLQDGSYILFSYVGKTLTGRITTISDENHYTVMTVNRDFIIETFTILDENIIQLIRA